MRRLTILLILALWASPAWCNPFIGLMSGGVAAASESNAVLAGCTTDLSAGTDSGQGGSGNLVYAINGTDYTASATGTLRYGYIRTGAARLGSNIKLCVYLKGSGTTYNLVETSSAAAISANSLIRVNFGGTNTITAGNHYIIGYIADGYIYVKQGTNTWSQMDNSGGSYASPPSTCNPASDTNSAFSEIQVYVTNYIQ